jgi:hypothetical protein
MPTPFPCPLCTFTFFKLFTMKRGEQACKMLHQNKPQGHQSDQKKILYIVVFIGMKLSLKGKSHRGSRELLIGWMRWHCKMHMSRATPGMMRPACQIPPKRPSSSRDPHFLGLAMALRSCCNLHNCKFNMLLSSEAQPTINLPSTQQC